MAFVTGIANSLADLLTAIQNACTANGWTLSGSVLHKGTCYVEVKISTLAGGGGYLAETVIALQGGTGIDGSNNLTGRSNAGPGLFCNYIRPVSASGVPFAFPATYDIAVHSAPDEVFVTVNYSTIVYQSCGFGQSAMPGLLGTGNWYTGTAQAYVPSGGYGYRGWSSSGDAATGNSVALFANTNTQGVDHSLDGTSWTTEGAIRDLSSLILRQPNQWNGESILMPMRVYAARPSGFVSPVLECAHARFVNLANLSDQQIITLGADKWKVYPTFRRSAALSDGIGSWYSGYALRYDGP